MTEPFQLGHFMAGEVGIEPTRHGVKFRCLTAWRLSYVKSALKLSKPQKERKTCR